MTEERPSASDVPYSVHVRFAPSAGHARRPVRWVEPPLTLRRANGALEMIGQSSDLTALTRWILSYGAYAEVLGPEVLRRWIAAEAQRVARLYTSDGYHSDNDTELRLIR